MEEKIKIETLISDVKEYAEERINLARLTVHEKVSKTIVSVTSILLVTVLSIFMLGFLSLAIAWMLGQLLHQLFLGFFIMGGIYLIAVIVIWFNREKWIGIPIMNSFIKHISDED